MTYTEKLRDPRWQKRRLEVLSAANFCCQACFDDSTELHVHHSLYRRKRDPWDYPDHELKALCVPCHKEAEEDRERLLSIMASVFPEPPVFQIAAAIEELQKIGDLAVWDWINCAQYPDLMKGATIRRRSEIHREDYSI